MLTEQVPLGWLLESRELCSRHGRHGACPVLHLSQLALKGKVAPKTEWR